MRKILFILFLVPLITKAQVYQKLPMFGYEMPRADIRFVLNIPSDTIDNKEGIARIDSRFFIGNGSYWSNITGSGSITINAGVDSFTFRSNTLIQWIAGDSTPFYLNKFHDGIGYNYNNSKFIFYNNGFDVDSIALPAYKIDSTLVLRGDTLGVANPGGGTPNTVRYLNSAGRDTSSSDFTYDAPTLRIGEIGNRSLLINGKSSFSFGDIDNIADGNILQISSDGVNYIDDIIHNTRLGINTATPDSTLHIVGGLKFDLPSKGAGKVLTSDANGAATWQTPSAGGSSVGDSLVRAFDSLAAHNVRIGAVTVIQPLYLTKGFLTQTGTGTPTFAGPSGLNSIAGTWARSSAGTYTYTKTGYFVLNKTFPSNKMYTDYTGNLYRVTRTSADVITLQTYTSGGVLADDILSAWEFEILIYN